jgi:hypothetical protein
MSHNAYIKPKPPTNATYTHNIQYPSGSLNPTDRKVITRNLCIDTLFRKNYNKTVSSNFLHTLPDPITNIISMKISAIEFPNAWYHFTSQNQSNEFTITIYNAPDKVEKNGSITPYNKIIKHKILIPNGNYQSDLFNIAMNNMFRNIGNGLEYIFFELNELTANCAFRSKTLSDSTQGGEVSRSVTNTYLLEQTIDARTVIGGEPNSSELRSPEFPHIPSATRPEYLTIDNPQPFYFTVDFRIESDPTRPLYKNAGWMMGFREPFYEVRYLDNYNRVANILATDGTQYYNWYLKSESSYGSSIQSYLFLEIDDFNKNFSTNTLFANTTNETYLGNNIMGRVSVVSGINTIITNTASDRVFKKREYFGPVKLEKLHIRLLNKFGDPVWFNGNDFSFVLEIEQLYS